MTKLSSPLERHITAYLHWSDRLAAQQTALRIDFRLSAEYGAHVQLTCDFSCRSKNDGERYPRPGATEACRSVCRKLIDL